MLTQKQELFALNLFRGMSQREAYIQAGYSPRMSPAAIDVEASRLADNPNVSLRVAERRRKAEDDAISTEKERRKVLTQIERATVADFVDEHGNLDVAKASLKTAAVQEIRTERTLVGVKTTLKLRDPVAAIAEHNKMDKVYSDAPVNNVNVIIPIKEVEVRLSDANGS